MNKIVIKKISSTKAELRQIKTNELQVMCNLSHTSIATNKGICLHILNNNSKYISSEYLKHKIFNDLKLSISSKIDLLTCIYYGATLLNYDNSTMLKINEYDFKATPTYQIIFKNGLQLNIYDNDAKSKKYFNTLKYIKKSISEIYFFTHDKVVKVNDINTYPPFAKKSYEYLYFGSYNPASKKDCIQSW